MRATTLLSNVLGLKQTRVVGFEFTATGLLVDVVPATRTPVCAGCYERVAKLYDGRIRTWRHLDLVGMSVTLRCKLWRVRCPRCGPTTELVPWAPHGTWFTYEFEEQTAYYAQKCDQTTVATTMGVAWPTVGRIVARVMGRLGPQDGLDGLTNIGVDELSYRRHHEYVTVVVDHTKQRVVWVRPGKNAETLREFFAELGPERTAKLEVVTIDMSAAYIKAVTDAAPGAKVVFDRFHVQKLAQEALDELRRAQVRELAGTEDGTALKKSRFALLKNDWNLTPAESRKLATVQATNKPLFRGYLLKAMLASILGGSDPEFARRQLKGWVGWAARSRLAPFVKVGKTIQRHFEGIVAYVATKLSNARTEGLNGKIRTITRRAYGFHDPSSLIGLIFLCCSGLVLTPLRRTPAVHPSNG